MFLRPTQGYKPEVLELLVVFQRRCSVLRFELEINHYHRLELQALRPMDRQDVDTTLLQVGAAGIAIAVLNLVPLLVRNVVIIQQVAKRLQPNARHSLLPKRLLHL